MNDLFDNGYKINAMPVIKYSDYGNGNSINAVYFQLIVFKCGNAVVGENRHVNFFEECHPEDISIEHCFTLAGVVSNDQLIVPEDQVSFPEADCKQFLKIMVSL